MEDEHREPRSLKEVWKAAGEQPQVFRMMRDSRCLGGGTDPYPLTRENVLLCLAGLKKEIQEEVTDLAIACFNRAGTPHIEGEGEDEAIAAEGEDIYIQLDEWAILRICNYRLDAFSIDISDRGIITRFKFVRPPILMPLGFENIRFFNHNDCGEDVRMFFDRRDQPSIRKKHGNVGDRFNPLGMAWKRSSTQKQA